VLLSDRDLTRFWAQRDGAGQARQCEPQASAVDEPGLVQPFYAAERFQEAHVRFSGELKNINDCIGL
jgi:hypothetical protein